MKLNISLSRAFTEKELRDKEVTVEVKLTGKAVCVDRVLSLLGMIQYNGDVGHSGVFGISWDGDGSDKIKVDGPIPKYREAWAEASSYGGAVEYVGANGTAFVITANDVRHKRVFPKSED